MKAITKSLMYNNLSFNFNVHVFKSVIFNNSLIVHKFNSSFS